MILTWAEAAAGLALLWGGGELLVRGASALALRLGVTPLAVGLTVVAFGTSAPELVVSLAAALTGADDIAVGNVVGSNICNIGLILGLGALVRPIAVQAQVIRFDAPLMAAVSAALLWVLADGRAGRPEGALLVAGLGAYLVWTSRLARREPAAVQQEFEVALPAASRPVAGSLARVVAGILALVGGGKLLVDAGVALATALGISQAVIGLTVVAVGTSLPELATSVVAAARGEGDIAVGNVVGSNLFNILGILGVTSLVSPLARGAIGWSDLGAMLGFALILIPLLVTRGKLERLEGAALLAGYVAYVAWRAAV